MLAQVDRGLRVGAGEDQLCGQSSCHLVGVVLWGGGQAVGALQLGEEEAVQLLALQVSQCGLWPGQEAEQGIVEVAQQRLAGTLQVGQVVLPEGAPLADGAGRQPGQELPHFVGHLRIIGEVQALSAQEAVQSVAEDHARDEEGAQDLGLVLAQGQVDDGPFAGCALDQLVAQFQQTALVAPQGDVRQVVEQGGVLLAGVEPQDGVAVLGAVEVGLEVIC